MPRFWRVTHPESPLHDQIVELVEVRESFVAPDNHGGLELGPLWMVRPLDNPEAICALPPDYFFGC